MSGAAAFFDVDGTVVDATIVHYLVHLKTRDLPQWKAALWKVAFLPRIPYYWLLDQYSRELFNRRFYYNYSGFSEDGLREQAEELFEQFMQRRIYRQAADRMADHRSRGDAVVLVSGSLRPLLVPLARQLPVDEVLAAEPEVADGVYTGRLAGKPLAGRRKAAVADDWARSRGVKLSDCHAYADSADDLALLESVGKPKAVNPDRTLRAVAVRRQWEVLSWRRSST